MSACNLCARKCSIDRGCGEIGFCNSSSTMTIGRADLHLWEEPPLKNSGALFFTNCSLRCVYCQNWKISQNNEGKHITADELGDIAFELKEKGAENINIVTGTHFAPQIIEGLTKAKERGLDLPIVWNTSSYETIETVKLLTGIVDVWLADYKYSNPLLAKDLSVAPDYCSVALASLSQMIDDAKYCEQLQCPGVIVRHLVLPGLIDNSKEAIRQLYENFGESAKLSIMSQYTPIIAQRNDPKIRRILDKYPSLARCLTEEEYEEVLDYADNLGIEDYFWQDGQSCLESFIPEFNLKD